MTEFATLSPPRIFLQLPLCLTLFLFLQMMITHPLSRPQGLLPRSQHLVAQAHPAHLRSQQQLQQVTFREIYTACALL